jgi:hypothetical protein
MNDRPKPSPTFVCKFSDGQIVRMTVYHAVDRKSFNLPRGVRLARHAHRSRTRKSPRPKIVEACFVDPNDGTILCEYTADEWEKILL